MRRGDNAEGVVIVGLGQKGQLAAKHAETFLFFYPPDDITPMSSSIRALFISSSKNKEPAVLVPFTKRNMLGTEQESEEFVFYQMLQAAI